MTECPKCGARDHPMMVSGECYTCWIKQQPWSNPRPVWVKVVNIATWAVIAWSAAIGIACAVWQYYER